MSLLQITDTGIVEKTSLTRKLTLGGITKAYPVYRVRLDHLFYNSQNDRIVTWISQYTTAHDGVSVDQLDKESLNNIIEKFIIESNPEAITKTKNNIALVNQREPGVVLSDGRIIDGNRRFTCLRLLSREDPSFSHFETVILDDSEGTSKKEIKMLELMIQHGEEQRVGYNLIDLTIGAYHDIIETELLTVKEYADSTNESVSEVNKRLEIAKLIIELLDYMNVPGQYHIAREKQVYSVLSELNILLKRCSGGEEREQLKNTVFANVMMNSINDNRKYIRSLKSMMETGLFSSYMKKQMKIGEEIEQKKKDAVIKTKEDLDKFVKDNEEIQEDLQISFDRATLNSKKEQSKGRPAQIINKSLSMLMDVDLQMIDKLSLDEKTKIKTRLNKLSDAVQMINEEAFDEPAANKPEPEEDTKIRLGKRHTDEPIVYCVNENKKITSLMFSVSLSAFSFTPAQASTVRYLVYFADGEMKELCPLQEAEITVGEVTKISFELNERASGMSEIYLILKSTKDPYNEAQQIIPFGNAISFTMDFDF